MAEANANTTPFLMTGDRPLPHNNEAEIAVLGAALLDPVNAIDVAVKKLHGTGCFFNPAHQAIFDCLVRLTGEKPGTKIDIIALATELSSAGKLEEVGGRAYLMQLLNSVPTAANIELYVDIVHQNAVLRRLIHAGTRIVSRCFDPQEDTRALLDDIESEILGVADMQSGRDVVSVGDRVIDAVKYIDRLRNNDASALGIQTGYADLDKLITGLRPAEMFVLAARPSIGKTALALNIVSNISLGPNPVPTGVFSLEMSSDLLVLRLLCSLARVNLGEIRDGAVSTARWQEILQAGQELKNAPVYIDDSGNLDIVEMRAKARRMHRDHKVGLFVVDYLQLMKPAGGSKNQTRENEVSQISGGIKSLAKELNVPIVVLAQLNRQAEQPGQRPRLAHLRESGAIEQDADVVALLHRERESETGADVTEGMDAELIIAKHRNGPTGLVPLTFLPTYTRFESRARFGESDMPDS